MEAPVSRDIIGCRSRPEDCTDAVNSEEEDPDDYPFPLTLRSPKKPTPMGSPLPGDLNGVP